MDEALDDKVFEVPTAQGKVVRFTVRQDRRLKKTSRWQWQGKNDILLRTPARLPTRVVKRQIEQIAAQVGRQVKLAERRSDAGLQNRAEYLNKKCFNGEIEWRAIRWVSNMEARLGSCSNGGTTDGHIRISEKIKSWPQWVINYVIAHELVHRLHPNHSDEFWRTLSEGYPLTERARGFIRGVSFVEGTQFDDAE